MQTGALPTGQQMLQPGVPVALQHKGPCATENRPFFCAWPTLAWAKALEAEQTSKMANPTLSEFLMLRPSLKNLRPFFQDVAAISATPRVA